MADGKLLDPGVLDQGDERDLHRLEAADRQLGGCELKMRQNVREAGAEQILAADPIDAARGLRHAHHAVDEAGAPRRVEACRRQHPDRWNGPPQRGDESFELALDVGERNGAGAVLQRMQRAGIEQSEELEPLLGIVLGGANAAQRPGLERAHIETLEHAPGTVEQQAHKFRRLFGNALDDAKPFGEVLRAREPARGNWRGNQ